MSNWIRNSTKRRRVGQPKPRSQHARVFNAQGIVYNACNVETERTKQIEFDLKHARDANERVEASQPLQRDARSLESKESTRTRDPLPSKEDKPSKALAALDHLQWKDPTTRRARILQTVDLVGLNTRHSWKPTKIPLQVPPTRPQLDKSMEVTDRTIDGTLVLTGASGTEDFPARRALHSFHSRAVSELDSRIQETIVGVDSPARVPALAHTPTLASQQPILAIPFSQDEMLSMDLTLSQSRTGYGSYEQDNAPFSAFLGHITGAGVGHSSSLIDGTEDTSMAENDDMSQSDCLRATPQVEDGEWAEGQYSDEEDMYQRRGEIPLLYPIVYDLLGFPIVDRPLDYRLRLSGDRSGVGWPLKRWKGDETDLLSDETIDIGMALEPDRLSSPTLWEETTTNSRGPYSRYPSDTDHSSFSYESDGPRELGTHFSAAFAMVRSPNMAPREEYVRGACMVPFAYQLTGDDGAILCGGAPENDVEEIRYSPQSEIVTLDYLEPGRTTEEYQVQCPEPAFDYSQEPTEVKPGDLEIEETMEAEEMIREDKDSPEAQVGSDQEPVYGFVLAPDLFGD